MTEKVLVLKSSGIQIDDYTVGVLANVFCDRELKAVQAKRIQRCRADNDGAREYFPVSKAGEEFQGIRDGYLGPWTIRKLRKMEGKG